MTRLVLTINERSKRGQLIMQLLDELKSKKDLNVLKLEAFEAAEEKIIAQHIRQGMKTPLLTLD